MSKTVKKVAILGGVRTPFVKSLGSYKDVTNKELLTETLKQLVDKYHLEGKLLGDVISGSVMLHPFDWNLTREAVLGSGLHPNTPGQNIQRACGTGLESANLVGLKIATGQIEVGIGAGSDTNSDVPLIGSHDLTQWLLKLKDAKTFADKLKAITQLRPQFLKPLLPAVAEPRTGLSMGDHTELMVKEWEITREDQDRLAYESHQNAARAYDEGFFDDLIFEFHGVKKDGITRKDTTLEKLAKLKPAFDKTSGKGTLTAGNSTPMTDGASAVLLSSEEWAKKHNHEIQAYLADVEVSAIDFVNGQGLLMAPTIAVARLLERNNLTLQDFDFYEIHEAFAGQVLCTLKAWESEKYCKEVIGVDKALGSIDRSKLNVKGGSLAVGHPFTATGGRIISQAAKILKEKGKGRILISICTAGGMGVAAIVER
jgi:acetyl-CoA C-acetyltransferase